jgi:transcriptional regulator with XRE-family HTH domain
VSTTAAVPRLTQQLPGALRRLRRERELSQTQLAAIAGGGICQQYISALERGLRPSHIVHVERLAKALDVDVLDLLGLPRSPVPVGAPEASPSEAARP